MQLPLTYYSLGVTISFCKFWVENDTLIQVRYCHLLGIWYVSIVDMLFSSFFFFFFATLCACRFFDSVHFLPFFDSAHDSAHDIYVDIYLKMYFSFTYTSDLMF